MRGCGSRFCRAFSDSLRSDMAQWWPAVDFLPICDSRNSLKYTGCGQIRPLSRIRKPKGLTCFQGHSADGHWAPRLEKPDCQHGHDHADHSCGPTSTTQAAPVTGHKSCDNFILGLGTNARKQPNAPDVRQGQEIRLAHILRAAKVPYNLSFIHPSPTAMPHGP